MNARTRLVLLDVGLALVYVGMVLSAWSAPLGLALFAAGVACWLPVLRP